jgi:apolipoprotein N-acyltransferase
VPLFTRALHEAKGIIKLCFFMGMIINILLAIWIFLDIRKRGEGSGIFIALALIAGVPAAIIYTLSRIADKKTGASS